VLIQVASSSVNPCDVDYLEFGVGCNGGSGVLGMDMAGTVVAVGEGCTRLKEGDRVWADTGGVKGDSGGMAQYALASEKQTGIVPSKLNLTMAGTIPLAGLTALEMFDKISAAMPGGKMKTNLTMVVTAGTGGTGFVGVQLGKHVYKAGLMITSTSGADDIALAKSLGADIVVDYKVQDDIFANLPDNSVDVVFDNYGTTLAYNPAPC
jgi:NADPH2:quinone reductase